MFQYFPLFCICLAKEREILIWAECRLCRIYFKLYFVSCPIFSQRLDKTMIDVPVVYCEWVVWFAEHLPDDETRISINIIFCSSLKYIFVHLMFHVSYLNECITISKIMWRDSFNNLFTTSHPRKRADARNWMGNRRHPYQWVGVYMSMPFTICIIQY